MKALYQVNQLCSISGSDTWSIILKHTCNSTRNLELFYRILHIYYLTTNTIPSLITISGLH